MVSIHSEEEHPFVVGLQGAPSDSWLGGRRDPGNHSNWVWSDGTPWDYTNWRSGEPNDLGGEDCAQTWTSYVHLWNDLSCGGENPFVCKKGKF